MERVNKGRVRALRVVTCFSAAAAALTADAQSWIGGSASGVWSDPANWSPGVPAGANTTQLNFGPSSPIDYTSTNDLPGAFVLNGVTFGGSSNRRIIAGNPLEFAASPDGVLPEVLDQTAFGERNFKAPIILDAETTFRSTSPTGGGLFIATGGISGPGKLKIVGNFWYYDVNATTPGPPDATFTGGVDVTGTLRVEGHRARTPAFGTGTITFHGDSAYRTGGGATSDPLAIATPLVVDGNLNMSAPAALNPGGTVTLDADLRVGGAFRYTGRPFVHAAGRNLLLDNAAGAGLNTLQFDAAAPVQINSDVADANRSAPSNPLLIRAGIDTAFTGRNAFGGDVTVEGYRGTVAFPDAPPLVTFSPASSFAGNVTVAGNARVRVASPASIAPGKTVTIAAGAFFEFGTPTPFDTSLLRTKISPASAGILALSATPGDGLDLTGYDNLFLGKGTNAALIEKPFTPANRTYRLAGLGFDSLFVRAGLLTGDNALVVGTGTSDGGIILEGLNTFSGGTTVLSGGLSAGRGALGTGPVRVTGTGRLNNFGVDSSNVLTGSGSLEVTDSARVAFTQANDYTGGTTVNMRDNLTRGVSVTASNALGTGPVTLQRGILAIDSGVTLPNAFYVNGGFLRLGGGTITNTVHLAPGTRMMVGDVDSLIGAGSVDADGSYLPGLALTVRREFSPEAAPGVPVAFKIGKAGSFLEDRVGLVLTPTSTLMIDLLGPGANDRVDVSTTATLDGALALAVAPGYIPPAGATFDVMTFASRTGEFDAVTANFPNAAEYEIQYLPDRVRVVVLTPEPATVFTLAAGALGRRRPRRT